MAPLAMYLSPKREALSQDPSSHVNQGGKYRLQPQHWQAETVEP